MPTQETTATQDNLEATIAVFLRQRMQDGDLSLEDIPTRLARYGLMRPEDFVDEMNERMGTDMPCPNEKSNPPSLESTVCSMIADLMEHDKHTPAIASTQTLSQLDMNELDCVELTMMLENHFNIEVDVEGFALNDSVETIVRTLKRYKVEMP
jgi:acyl carrier protein